MKETYVFDIECYGNCFLVGVKRVRDGKIRIFEQSDREKIDYDLLRRILSSALIIGYNSKTYDIPVLWYAIQGADVHTPNGGYSTHDGVYRRDRTNAEIKLISNRIIQGGLKWWDVEREIGIEIPRGLNHVDLIEVQPNPFASLKMLNGRMHGRWMQDLPYHHEDVLTFEQIDRLREYLHNDLAATESLWEILREPMELRETVGAQIGVDLRSMSDTQMGLAIIKHRVEKALGHRLRRKESRRAAPFQYAPPAYLSFQTPVLRDMLERVRQHTFIVQANGKVELPDFLTQPFRIGETEYAMGIGGLHSTEANRSVRADHEFALVDADVASYYPAIILSLGLFPQEVGPVFLDVYRGIRDDRVAAKRAKNKAVDKGLKIALNGTFGSLGSPYKFVYAPHLLIAVTLTGQLALLMLIERAAAAGIQVVSANTDGVVFRCPRADYAGLDGARLRASTLADITAAWEHDTQFDLEFAEYRALYNQNVNSYFAIKADGGHKRKGPFSNPWNPHPDDWNPFYGGQLMKNPQATICSDAALALIKDGTPVRETIRACRDIRQFVTVIKVTKGATWRGGYLGKVVRYYWGLDGDPILEAEPNALGNHKQVAKTEGCRPCMTLPDELPDDIDYTRYEAETEHILTEIGFYGRPAEPVKFGRLTPAKLERLLPWLIAA